MPATYRNFGVEFLYPDNWTVTDEQSSGWPRSVGLQCPDGSFFVLQVHPAAPPLKLANEVLQTMRGEYASLEAESVVEQVEAEELVGFDLDFYYLDMLISARVRAARVGDQTYVWFFQGESRDFDRMMPVFQAIETGLLRSLHGRAPQQE
jgi:hypothetical protein